MSQFPFFTLQTGKMYDHGKAPPYSMDYREPPPIAFQGSQPTATQNTIIIETSQFGETPKQMVCPNCRAEIVTRVSRVPSATQHIGFFVLLLFCFCFSCVPYCIDSLANVKHECPTCSAHLGTFKPWLPRLTPEQNHIPTVGTEFNSCTLKYKYWE